MTVWISVFIAVGTDLYLVNTNEDYEGCRYVKYLRQEVFECAVCVWPWIGEKLPAHYNEYVSVGVLKFSKNLVATSKFEMSEGVTCTKFHAGDLQILGITLIISRD